MLKNNINYKETTNASYDKHVDYFSKFFKKRVKFFKRPEFQIFLNSLKGNKILDLGSGSGDHALFFQKKGLSVTCIDLSEAFIKICKKKGLDAKVMDIEKLKLNRKYDGIWAVNSLLHIPKKKIPMIIENLSIIIKKNGILYVVVKEGSGEVLLNDKHDESTQRFFSFWQKDELLKLFEPNFKLIEFWKSLVENTVFLSYLLQKK